MEQYVSTLISKADDIPKDHPFGGWQLYPQTRLCTSGALTPTGAAQHVQLGAFFNAVYLNKWKLLGQDLWDEVQMVSTKKNRTFQSGIAFMYGMLRSDLDLRRLSMIPATSMLMCTRNTPVVCSCAAARKHIKTISPEDGLTSGRKRIRRLYSVYEEALNVEAAFLPRVAVVMDVSIVHLCHGRPLQGEGQGPAVPANTIRAVVDAVNQNGALRVKTPKMQRLNTLKMHGLISEIVMNMDNMKQGRSRRKFILYSGHDLTIEPLAAALNISDGSWPRYGSRIVFELYSSAHAQSNSSFRDMFVRVLFDGRDVTWRVGGCGRHHPDNLCRLSDFKAYVSADGLRTRLGVSYLQACKGSAK